MVQEELDAATVAASRRWSWDQLRDGYRSNGAYWQFGYIVKRLIDTPIAERFTIGETFTLPYRDPNAVPSERPKTVEELHIEASLQREAPSSTGRALYFTTGAYWADLHLVPHVSAFIGAECGNLFAQYGHGLDVVESHICRTGKEIPCILSLLELLGRNA